MKTIGIIGAGGHCKVIIDLIEAIGLHQIVGIFDDYKEGSVSGVKILGKLSDLSSPTKIDQFIIAIGNDTVRKTLDNTYQDLLWATLVHPSAIVSKSAFVGAGSVVCAGAVLQPEVVIGKHCIINTNCNVDHETIIGDYCSVCPGATICGRVTIGEKTFVGANATIIQNLVIGVNCVLGAGTVIIRDISDNSKIVGNPGKILSSVKKVTQ
jgi:sugar O-acyltransferase (sialic acid O-acetyltransferase NeuD family)